jgi:hypothetical protein
VSSDGTQASLGIRRSGWAITGEWNHLPALFPVGELFVQAVGSDEHRQVPLSVWNPAGDVKTPVTLQSASFKRFEPFGTKGALFSAPGYGGSATLIPDLADPNHALSLSGETDYAISWYHACGSSILKIEMNWYSHRHPKWTLSLLGADGLTTRHLKQRLAQGTDFNGCDGSTAVFHRPRHDGGIHQWSVSLAG